VSYLWHNPLGVAVVLIVGVAVSLVTARPVRTEPAPRSM